MSSLWTPEGEHRVRPAGTDDSGPGGPGGARAPSHSGGPGAPDANAGAPPHGQIEDDDFDMEGLEPEERAELAGRLEELRRQLLGTPAEVVVANHAYGLFELAAIHLSQQPPHLDQARLAVDAMASLVEGLAGRLGEAEPSLKDALAQIRLAFVQINETLASDGGAAQGVAP